VTAARFLCGALGGIILPAAGLGLVPPGLTIAIAAFVLALAGELCERYLFFAAAPASRMPGGVG
jgi:DMSO reductase anchor subunit